MHETASAPNNYIKLWNCSSSRDCPVCGRQRCSLKRQFGILPKRGLGRVGAWLGHAWGKHAWGKVGARLGHGRVNDLELLGGKLEACLEHSWDTKLKSRWHGLGMIRARLGHGAWLGKGWGKVEAWFM